MASARGPLGTHAETYDAEIQGALQGLRIAKRVAEETGSTIVEVFLNNHIAAQRLHAGVPGPMDYTLMGEAI